MNKRQLEAGPYTGEIHQKEGVKWTGKKPRQGSKILGQSRRISSWYAWVEITEIWGDLGEDGDIESQEIQKWEKKDHRQSWYGWQMTKTNDETLARTVGGKESLGTA